MTKLDISAYGVQELNHQEMVETEGGFWPLVVAAVVAVGALCTSCNNQKTVYNTTVIVNSDNSGNTSTGAGAGAGSGANVGSQNGNKKQ